MAAFGGTLQSIGLKLSAAITLPLVGLGIGTIKASADMDVLKRALLSTTGSAEEAAKQFDRLQVIAKLPGIDLPGAVRGSIRLQNYGLSAGLAEKALKVFSNAVAGAGGTADDTAESLRQLGQMYGRGKVTMDNLRIILERVPQAAAVIRKEWGSEALADPAKAFEKLGLTSSQVIETLIDRMGDIPQTTAGVKTAIENLNQEITKSAARIGEHLVPAVVAVIPHLEKMAEAVADAADGFMQLPSPVRNTGLALVGIAAALPVVIVALGTVLSNVAALRIALAGTSISLKGFAGAFSVIGTAAAGAGAAVAYFMNLLITNRQNTVDTTARSIEELNKKLGYGTPAAFRSGTDAILGYMRVLAPAEKGVVVVGDATEATAASVEKLTKKMPALAKVTADSEILMRLMAESTQNHARQLDKAADILRTYGTVSIDTAISLLKVADAQFRINQALDEAPEIHQKFDFKDIPKFNAPSLPFSDPAEFQRMSQNIGEFGMQTREQYDQMKAAAQSSGKGQSKALQQVSLVINDLGRSITDIIFKGGKFGDMLKSVAMQGAQSITRLLIEGALTKLTKKLISVSGLMGKIFGGEAGDGAKAAAAKAAAAKAGDASGGIGSLAAAANPITAIVTAVSSVVSAISAVVANFQFAAMNKTLDLIEREVRYTKIYTGEQGQSILWSTQTTAARLLLANATLDSIAAFSSDMLGNLQQLNQRGSGGSGNTYVFQPAGGYYTSDSALRDLFDQFARYMKAQGA